jgi:hypothetical protein
VQTKASSSRSQKPRELRTSVVLATRIRADSGWGDARILNISSRGMLITSSRVDGEGSTVELRHGDQAIVARVVWRKGTQAGLRTDERIPVEDIVALSRGSALRLTAPQWSGMDRRKRPRPSATHDESRQRSRTLEFASIAVIGISLAATLFSMVETAFARPLAMVQAALGG